MALLVAFADGLVSDIGPRGVLDLPAADLGALQHETWLILRTVHDIGHYRALDATHGIERRDADIVGGKGFPAVVDHGKIVRSYSVMLARAR